MITSSKPVLLYGGILLVGIFLPLAIPAYQTQIAIMWMMVTFALTWDILGGRMGYNSFGNIIFFGVGMYVAALMQHKLYFNVGQFEVISDQFNLQLTPDKYVFGLGLGMAVGAVVCVIFAWILGSGILRLRGHYFAICTLGLGVAVGEIAGTIDAIGAGSGMSAPVFPLAMGATGLFYSYFFFILTVVTFFSLKWLYSTRFGLAINAIRDDEDKAEAMGLHTTRYKTLAWCVSAFFLSFAGAGFGHLNGFIDPLDVAFPGATFGVWMVLMAILGGKGTLWGPVVGAMVFHITQEFFWSTLLGWQRVALGLLIIVVVVFFPLGIMGWAREKWPERFGHTVEEKS
jgi:branched-chain amino acid transport system permease protein